jgi:hypothetical protein
MSVKISSPTCEDLGIPKETDEVCFPIFASRIIKNPSLHIDGIRYEATLKGYPQKVDPYSPVCMIPLPLPFGTDHVGPTFVRRRNERERDRVKCVKMRDANIGKQTSSVSFGMPRSSHVGDDIFTGISSVQI